MAEPRARLASVRTEWLDRHLERLCIILQLTSTQFKDAESKYQAVGKWLSAPGSPLFIYAPEIYPQGSMLLGTTIRPWRGEEFDLDLVCQLHWCAGEPPAKIYRWVHNRLADHETYRLMLEPLKRCLRLNYAGDFHLDSLPACPDGSLGNGAIMVPDRKLDCWMPSNPKGFADWFFKRCQLRDQEARLLLEKRIEPLPSPVPSDYKYPLQRVVQLMKRHRDSFFDGGHDIARSVILTTLAGHFYQGQPSLSRALDSILDGIHAAVEAIQQVPRVENPVNPGENFADTWDQPKYERFKSYIRDFRREFKRVLYPSVDEERMGLEKTTGPLGGLFGSSEVKEALRQEAKEMNEQRNSNRLAVTTLGMLTSTPARAGLIAVPPNNFFGR